MENYVYIYIIIVSIYGGYYMYLLYRIIIYIYDGYYIYDNNVIWPMISGFSRQPGLIQKVATCRCQGPQARCEDLAAGAVVDA